MVLALREEIVEMEGGGLAAADLHVPLHDGGVLMHKIGATMHDTCSLANAIPKLIKEMREESGQEFFGVEAWLEKSNTFLDFLCGNHTRNLPCDAFNRLFQKYLVENLGAEFDAAGQASGANARLGTCGKSVLRAISKIAHVGFGCHAKGDGIPFAMFLRDNYPHLTNRLVGRAELSKRQDWCLEMASIIFELVEALLAYNIKCLELG